MTTVHIVLRKPAPKITGFVDLVAASRALPAEIVGAYTEEIEAARLAGLSPNSWYETTSLSGPATGPATDGYGRYEFLVPQSGTVSAEVLRDVLGLIGYRSYDLVSMTESERVITYDWAIREYLIASDNDVPRRERPSFIEPLS